jgi:clan AA aspartic protease
MITGYVNSKLDAVISLPVYGPQGLTHEIEAVIDTGYSGYLALPNAVIAALGLSSVGLGYLTLADDSEIVSALYPATLVWDGQERAVEVDSLETEALVGMALMEGYDLKVRVRVGGRVTIRRFSDRAATTAKPRGAKH